MDTDDKDSLIPCARIVGGIRYCACGWTERDCERQQNRDESSERHDERIEEIVEEARIEMSRSIQ